MTAAKISTTEAPGWPGRIGLGLIWLYGRTLSPLFYLAGARCRHAPGCSHYAADAIRRHGLHKGAWLALARVQRCHPWGTHGFDPAPETLRPQGWRVWRYGDWKGPPDTP